MAKENIVEKKDKNKEKSRIEKEKSIEAGVDFGNEENTKLFNELSEDGKNFVNKLHEGTRQRVIDKPKIIYNQALYKWHEQKSINLSSKLSDCSKEIDSFENLITRQEERLGSFHEKWGGLPADVQKAAIKEKRELQSYLEKEKNKKDKLQSNLEFRNNKKAIYENNIKQTVKEVVERVEEKLDPHEKRIESLQNKRNEIDTEVQKITKVKSEVENELEILKKEYEEVPLKSERLAIKYRVKKIEAELKRSNKYIYSRVKARTKIETRLTHVDHKANYWRNTRNEFARISQRETLYQEAGKPIIEPVDLEKKFINLSGHELAPTPKKLEKKTVKEKGNISPYKYIQTWNNYFGSELKINPDSFFKTIRISKKKKFSLSGIESFLKIYAKALKFSEKKLTRRLKSLQAYLKIES